MYPLFICPGKGVRKEIPSLPGQYHLSVDELGREAEAIAKLGIPSVMLFGLPEKKDERGQRGLAPGRHRSARDSRAQEGDARPHAWPRTAACASTPRTATAASSSTRRAATWTTMPRWKIWPACVAQANAGADIVAPSGMMDGTIGFLRDALDEAGHENVILLSYAVKYASAYYGPFRVAADSAPAFGDRRGYQMDPANLREAIREVELDVEEGATW
jgi:porphobilinogen synthase